MNDHQLVAELKSGEYKAFERMYETYFMPLCDFALLHTGDKEVSRDIVQRTFLALWESRAQLEIHSSLRSYLYVAVKNRCLNQIKHEKIKQRHAKHHLYVSSVSSNEDRILLKELELRIERALLHLPDQCREVFRLSRFEHLKYQEIADRLNISVKTVESHMGKALRLMREELADYLPLLIVMYPYLFTLIP